MLIIYNNSYYSLVFHAVQTLMAWVIVSHLSLYKFYIIISLYNTFMINDCTIHSPSGYIICRYLSPWKKVIQLVRHTVYSTTELTHQHTAL